jgi:putative hydrolase of the HAD superfamily
MFSKIKAIYFDLDNTLIDRNEAHLSCIKHFFDSYLPAFFFETEQFLIEQNDNSGYTDRSEFCEWFIQYYQPQGWDESSFWNYMQTNISSFVPPISKQLKAQLVLLKQQYRIGIITNGSIENQSNKIQQVQLNTIFKSNDIYISQQYKTSKPDKALFEIVLSNLKLSPSELLYVGDDPMNDILGATQLGIKTCWVSHNREWSKAIPPDLMINNILNLFDVINTSKQYVRHE